MINEIGSKTFIFTLDDIISEQECEMYKSIIDEHANNKANYGVNENVICNYLSFTDTSDEILSKIKIIFETIIKAMNNHPNVLARPLGIENGSLRKITDKTRMHTDHIIPGKQDKFHKDSVRMYSIIIALNDDYEGGELHFPQQDVTVKLKRGQAILFPPYWTHPHGTNFLQNSTCRYTINTWAIGIKSQTHVDK
tara:strand:- start:346 stop:930 length:585 start_codon:yes stop_codon:yes gene_type:complete